MSFPKDHMVELIHSKIFADIPISRKEYLLEKAQKVPDLLQTPKKYFMTREEALIRSFKHGVAWKTFSDQENLTYEEKKLIIILFNELTGHIMHYTFFLPSLELQASKEQKEKWISKCETLEYIGCYAQTELGHGSNVRGIELEARYDHGKKEFVFNSPTVTATKWWIGGLGMVATHVLVVARLIIGGSDYGPNAFFIHIRDLKTHEPFEGVVVGEVGPKIGVNSIDHGYLILSQFRQPKEVMLNRFAKINESGQYEILDPNGIKILYLSLTRARAGLIFDTWVPLSISLTISIRYSLFREQFSDPDNASIERKILDYQSQQHKLFRVLSKLYFYVFMKSIIKDLYERAEENLRKGDDSDLPFLHCLVSLYKSYFTAGAVDGIEECRRACGGHGFLMHSGLPSCYLDSLPAITVDGDNSVMILQAAKYFMGILRGGKVHESLLYLKGTNEGLDYEPSSPLFHQKCFELAARQKFQRLLKREQTLMGLGKAKNVIWNTDLQIEATEACEAAFNASIHGYFTQSLNNIPHSCKPLLESLRQIFATSELEKFSSELLRANIPASTLDQMKQIQLLNYTKIRPHALDLIKIFNIPEITLNSFISTPENSIYKEMLKVTKELNPLNKAAVFPGYDKFQQPKL